MHIQSCTSRTVQSWLIPYDLYCMIHTVWFNSMSHKSWQSENFYASKSPSNEKQMFRISCNYNKVFDIEERKKFCSDVCFRRSMFILGKFYFQMVLIHLEMYRNFPFSFILIFLNCYIGESHIRLGEIQWMGLQQSAGRDYMQPIE